MKVESPISIDEMPLSLVGAGLARPGVNTGARLIVQRDVSLAPASFDHSDCDANLMLSEETP